nr:hypothetical protein [Tanacetum cinerariifolium]
MASNYTFDPVLDKAILFFDCEPVLEILWSVMILKRLSISVPLERDLKADGILLTKDGTMIGGASDGMKLHRFDLLVIPSMSPYFHSITFTANHAVSDAPLSSNENKTTLPNVAKEYSEEVKGKDAQVSGEGLVTDPEDMS